MLNATNVILFQ